MERIDVEKDMLLGAMVGAANAVTIAAIMGIVLALGEGAHDYSWFGKHVGMEVHPAGATMVILVLGLPFGAAFGMMFGSMSAEAWHWTRRARIINYSLFPLLALGIVGWCWNDLFVHAIGPTIFWSLVLERLTYHPWPEAPRAILRAS